MAPAAPRIAVLPAGGPWASGAAKAIQAGGGIVSAPEEANGLIWTDAGPTTAATVAALKDALGRLPGLQWVQLPLAGVERYAHQGVFDHQHLWTCAKGLYAAPVAEHALALTLACLRHLKDFGCATSWMPQAGASLYRRPVTIFGGGGIAEELIRLLVPFGCQVTVVRKRPTPMVMDSSDGAPPVEIRVLGWEDRVQALAGADVVVLALALTDETAGFLGRAEFEQMPPHAVVVNIARGRHIVTADLVTALTEGQIAAAGLDVTDPEPLPEDHPLWALRNCLITPHTANTQEMAIPLLVGRIVDNVRRFGAGETLEGLVDPDLGY